MNDRDPPVDRRPGAWFYVPAAALAALAWGVHAWSCGRPWYGMDDAYIIAHNAQVLHSGHDPNYVGTPALAGTTSPVYLALVALLLTAIPLPWTLDVAGWLAAGAFVIGVAHLARVAGASALWSFVLVVTAAVLAETPHQLTNGLETGLMLAVVTWAIALHIDVRPWTDASGRVADVGCVLSGLLPFVRTDLTHFALLLWGGNLFLRRRAAASFRASLPSLVRGIGLFGAAFLPWLIWCWVSLHSPYPTTGIVKRYFYAQAFLPSATKTELLKKGLEGFGHELGFLSFGWLFLLALGDPLLVLAFVVFAIGFLWAYWAELPEIPATYEYRYLYPFVPFLLAGFALALGKKLRWRRFRVAVLATLAVGLASSLRAAPAHWEQHLRIRGYARDDLAGIAGWCNEHLEPDAKLLVHDAGYIAYGTKFRLTDLVGLKTPWVVPYHRDLTFPTNGALQADAIHLIALRARPSYLVVLDTWEHDYRIAHGLADHGWTVVRMTHPGQFAFDVYQLSPPSPGS